MSHNARHRRRSERGASTSRTMLTLAFTGATAAMPLLTNSPAQASPPKAVNTDAASGTKAASHAASIRVHVVRTGENLSEIAQTLHFPGGWQSLYADNRQTVGPDPNLIRPGERLQLPVAGTLRAGPVGTPQSASTPPAVPASDVTGTAAEMTPMGIPGAWSLSFDDEFNGNSLDTANWSTGWFGSGITQPVQPDEQECYDPSQVSVSGGYLHLDAVPKSESCGGETRPYTSGMVTTDKLHEFTNGAFEARVYLPAAPDGGVADWPAFWADGTGNWPSTGEMDIMEGLSGETCFHYHDPAGGPGGCQNVGPGWHTFGADWNGNNVTYYYDGHDVGTLTTDSTDDPKYLILNNAVGGSGGESTPADMLVDYVRVWTQS
jgi:hypothetical protein